MPTRPPSAWMNPNHSPARTKAKTERTRMRSKKVISAFHALAHGLRELLAHRVELLRFQLELLREILGFRFRDGADGLEGLEELVGGQLADLRREGLRAFGRLRHLHDFRGGFVELRVELVERRLLLFR